MAITASKISVSQSIKWTPGSGDSISFAGSESFTQAGTLAGMETVNATATTSAVPLFSITGPLYLGIKNTDANATVYVDTVTPVVASVAAHVLAPGKALALYTTTNTWYMIASSGTPEVVVAAVQP